VAALRFARMEREKITVMNVAAPPCALMVSRNDIVRIVEVLPFVNTRRSSGGVKNVEGKGTVPTIKERTAARNAAEAHSVSTGGRNLVVKTVEVLPCARMANVRLVA